MKPLYKSTIIIWSEFDPRNLDMSALACEAEHGAAYCSKCVVKKIRQPQNDPDWDGNTFFDREF